MTEEAREIAENIELYMLRAQNKAMRDQIEEMGRIIDAIRTIITLYYREGCLVASSKERQKIYDDLIKKFPFSI